MHNLLKRVVVAGALIASMVTSALSAAPAMAAGTADLTFNPTSTSVAVGASFSVPVNINVAGGTTFGDQFGVTFDPAVLSLTSVTDGTFYSNYAATQSGCSALNVAGWTPATGGASKVGADTLLGCTTGAAGTGTIATFNFTALAGVNAITALNFTPVNATGTQINNITTVTTNSLNMTVGTPPAAKLALTGVATTAVSGNPSQFNVAYAVQNTGTLPADNATHSITVTIVSGATTLSTDTIALPIAVGASSATKTDGPFTIVGTLENITITADSAATAGGPATANTAYQFAAISATGNTNIDATLAATLVLTAPPSIPSFVLTPGQVNTDPDGNLAVNSNVSFTVTAADANAANNGKFTEFSPTSNTFVAGGAQLINPLVVEPNNAAAQDVTLSGVPQNLVSGTIAAEPAAGYLFPITFIQTVGFNDAPVKAPDVYLEVVTFAAAGTF